MFPLLCGMFHRVQAALYNRCTAMVTCNIARYYHVILSSGIQHYRCWSSSHDKYIGTLRSRAVFFVVINEICTMKSPSVLSRRRNIDTQKNKTRFAWGNVAAAAASATADHADLYIIIL